MSIMFGESLKAMSRGTIFLATCNAILLLSSGVASGPACPAEQD